MDEYYVYIITNIKNGTLYIGMTNDLGRRMQEHKLKESNGFSKRYGLDKLVYFETFESSNEAFIRERQMKKWKREWKIKRIVQNNPEWKDLAENWE